MLDVAVGSHNLCSLPCPQVAECTCSEASQVLEQTLSSSHQMGYITWVAYARYVWHSIWMEQNGLGHMIQRQGEEPLGYICRLEGWAWEGCRVAGTCDVGTGLARMCQDEPMLHTVQFPHPLHISIVCDSLMIHTDYFHECKVPHTRSHFHSQPKLEECGMCHCDGIISFVHP